MVKSRVSGQSRPGPEARGVLGAGWWFGRASLTSQGLCPLCVLDGSSLRFPSGIAGLERAPPQVGPWPPPLFHELSHCCVGLFILAEIPRSCDFFSPGRPQRKRRGGAVNSRQAQKRTREVASTPEMALEAEPIELEESGKIAGGRCHHGHQHGTLCMGHHARWSQLVPGTATSQHSPSEPQHPRLKRRELSRGWDASA